MVAEKDKSKISSGIELHDAYPELTNWRKLGMVLADSLDSVQEHVQLLPRPHLDQQNIVLCRLGFARPFIPRHLVVNLILHVRR